jgi:hypothetical protein
MRMILFKAGRRPGGRLLKTPVDAAGSRLPLPATDFAFWPIAKAHASTSGGDVAPHQGCGYTARASRGSYR